jgi:hypothetical protein
LENIPLEVEKMIVTLLQIDVRNISDVAYKGMIVVNNTQYALFNITDIIDIYSLSNLNLNTWFALTSELINTECPCSAFLKYPELGMLKNDGEYYILPDAVYTGTNQRDISEFQYIFGHYKSRAYTNHEEHYYFYRSVHDIREKWINRYALFNEGILYLEVNDNFSLRKDEICSPCIAICYVENRLSAQPNMLVQKNDIFISLSYYQK